MIYNSSLFTLSELSFQVKNVDSLDSMGNPTTTESLITIKAQLDGIGFSKSPYIASQDMGKTEETDLIFIGHCVDPKSLPPGIEPGAVGTGVINGELGEVKLLPSDQPSIALARQVFGDRIKVKFTRRGSTLS